MAEPKRSIAACTSAAVTERARISSKNTAFHVDRAGLKAARSAWKADSVSSYRDYGSWDNHPVIRKHIRLGGEPSGKDLVLCGEHTDCSQSLNLATV